MRIVSEMMEFLRIKNKDVRQSGIESLYDKCVC